MKNKTPTAIESAFEDALMTVSVANTANFLRNRLLRHPLVSYIADSFPLSAIEEKLLNEIESYDRSIQKATTIVLLLLAVQRLRNGVALPPQLLKAIDQLEFRWVKDLVGLDERNSPVATRTTVFDGTPPPIKKNVQRRASANEFISIP